MKKRAWMIAAGMLLLLLGAVPQSEHLRFGSPGNADAAVEREGFLLGFSTIHRQPLWVLYRLTPENLEGTAKRQSRYRSDPEIAAAPTSEEYTHSGYDRGQMVPAADMIYSEEAVRDVFLMSNVCPQLPGFNRGIWLRLEKQVRKIASREREIFVASGPVFAAVPKTSIGTIPVPEAFFKVIYIPASGQMLGYLLPHATSREELQKFLVPVETIEAATGLKFFPQR